MTVKRKRSKKRYTKLQKKEMLTGFLLALPAIAGMLVFFLIPFGVAIFISFTSGVGTSDFVGLRNYLSMLQNSAFQLAAGNTAKFIGVAVPLIMVISLLIALLLYQKLKGYDFFRTVFIFPLVLPVASVVLLFQLVFDVNGAFNSLLMATGLPIDDWLNSSNAFFVLVLLYVWKNTGYNIVLFLAALNSIPKDFYEAATVDGASGRNKLFSITLPLIVPYLFFILIMSVINSFKSFREAYILCGDHPNASIYMLQHFMNNNFENLNYLRLSTAAILVFLVIFILVFILLRVRRKSGGVGL